MRGWSHRPRVPIAAIAGAAGIAATIGISTRIESLDNRPGATLMVALVVIIAATLSGGRAVGLGLSLLALAGTAFFLTRPAHSLTVHTDGVRILLAGFAVAAIVVTILVARLAVTRRDAEAAWTRADRLQLLTASLSRARTAAAVYEVVLMEGREALRANAGMVALPSSDGAWIELVATLGFSADEQAGWQRFPSSLATPLGDAVTKGVPVFLDEGELTRRYPDVQTSASPTASVPLVAQGPVLGALGFRFERDHRFSETERDFAATLAEQCAYALERARLFDAEQRAREALAVLASVGEHLARTLDPNAALRTLAELVVPAVCDQCVVDLVQGSRIERRALVHADPALQDAARTLESFAPDFDSLTPVAVAIREGKTQLIPLTQELPDGAYQSDAHRTAVQQIELRSMLTAPMLVRGKTIGALSFGWKQAREFDDDDIELAEQLARRVGLALENGTLYQAAHGERERLSALVRQLPLGVLIAEAASGQQVLANARAEHILGATSTIAADAPHMELVRQALEGASVSDRELVLRRADGSLGVISISVEPVRDADGRIVSAVGSLYDLTEYRRREETLSFLADASEALTQSLDFETTLSDLVQLAVPRLADWCSIDLLDHGQLRNVGIAYVDGSRAMLVRDALRDRPADVRAQTGAAAAIRTGRSELIAEIVPSRLADGTSGSDLLGALHEIGVEPCSSMTAPLRAHGRTLGAVTLVAAESGRRFSEADLAVVEDLARRAALAIDNSRLYEAQREIAHTLQQSLLPGTLVQPPGMEIAARYRPAGVGAEVGGDFYDAWPIADGYAVAIGDVAGKGPAAAALTALTRHAMRVASRYESSPSRVLEVANEAILSDNGDSEFCTAALAFLRPAHGGYLLNVACAGHAPPLVLRRGTTATEAAGICGTLLGVDVRATFHDYETQLGVGDLLAFWTDGVTERRRSGVLFGEERLGSLISELGGCPAEEVVERIDRAVVAFAPGLPDDDVAILVARITTEVGLGTGHAGIQGDATRAADARRS